VLLQELQLVFCRTLKPFPLNYLYSLQTWEPHIRFLNRPASKIRQMRSSFLCELAAPFLPPTLVSRDPEAIGAFLDHHGVIVAKRPNSTGGRGVFRLRRQHGQLLVDGAIPGEHRFGDLKSVLAYLEQDDSEPLLFSRYLPRTLEGDKRVLVVAGEVFGSYQRRSASGHWVNNLSQDGSPEPAPVSDEELAAIAATSPSYRRLGLNVLGYDFLLDDDGTPRISEINVGNVGGFATLERLGVAPAMQQLLAWIEDFARAPGALTIRSAEACDDSAIAAIWEEANTLEVVSMLAGSIDTDQIRRKREELGERELLLVAERWGEVIGWAEAKTYSPREGYRACCETSIYLRASEAGRGHGRRLQTRLMQDAAALGYRHLVARVVASNARSLAFHQAAGYELVGVQRRIGFLHGRWHDVAILQHVLP
jgi:L-amino acid N-acyltransferase YncA/glutathione synthase/RimK-type ligase-like ATP-grasp enzyme